MEYASPFSVIDTIAIIPTKRKTPWGILYYSNQRVISKVPSLL